MSDRRVSRRRRAGGFLCNRGADGPGGFGARPRSRRNSPAQRAGRRRSAYTRLSGQDPYTSGTFQKCLHRALDESGYDAFRNKQPPRSHDERQAAVGIGIGCIVEHTGQGASRYRIRGVRSVPGFDSAHVEVQPNGRAVVGVSQATQGQGHLTAFAQVAAEQLALDVEDVTVIEGDTDSVPTAPALSPAVAPCLAAVRSCAPRPSFATRWRASPPT